MPNKKRTKEESLNKNSEQQPKKQKIEEWWEEKDGDWYKDKNDHPGINGIMRRNYGFGKMTKEIITVVRAIAQKMHLTMNGYIIKMMQKEG